LKIVPAKIYPLFAKEILAQIRNKHYIRLKIISLLIFCLILLFLNSSRFQDTYFNLVSLTTFVFIWVHSSHQFNEKYVLREPVFFIKTLPFRFYQYWLAKFLSEFLYILVFICLLLIFLTIHDAAINDIFSLLVGVIIFAFFILSIITLFKILFYDNPRFAGYAYHFLVIFSVIMIINYYLVGPIITIAILIYLTITSYRHFVK
jgi:hypothetical protein